MDLVGTANTGSNPILDMALLAWPRLLPLALMIDPNTPIYNKICEAVRKLSEGGWNKFRQLATHGVEIATSSTGLQLLSIHARQRNHPILELCKSFPQPPPRFGKFVSPRKISASPILFQALCDHLMQNQSSLHRAEREAQSGTKQDQKAKEVERG